MDCGTPFCNSGCPVNNIIPDFNDLVYRGDWKRAIEVLHSTNNFPEFTGRVCPAPCEAACTLNVNDDAVGIKSIEHADHRSRLGRRLGPAAAARPRQTGKTVAVVGSGPGRAGRGAATGARRPCGDGVREERIASAACCATASPTSRWRSRTSTGVSSRCVPRAWSSAPACWSAHRRRPQGHQRCQGAVTPTLKAQFDAVLLTGGAETSRDLPVPGRDLDGVHFAMEFLPQQNKVVAGDKLKGQIMATGKHVIVIGGGDTGSDCVGTSNRHGAASVTQFELLPMPPEQENKPLVWPYWPTKLRTSSSHEEGCEREFAIATKEFVARQGKGRVTALRTVRIEMKDGKLVEVPGTEQEYKADLVLLAMGFVAPVASVLEAFGIDRDARGNARAGTDALGGYKTNVEEVFAAGDMRRGQSLIVWAIREGRQAARAVDRFLMGHSDLP